MISLEVLNTFLTHWLPIVSLFAIAEKVGVPLGYLLHIRPEFDSQGTSLGILSRLQFRGKSVEYWQGLLAPIGRIAPKGEGLSYQLDS